MTLDREIRFTPWQIHVTQGALRDEIKRRSRSIKTAERNMAAGAKVQQNVLQEHFQALETAREVLTNLTVAERAIARQLVEKGAAKRD